MAYQTEPQFTNGNAEKTGILLINPCTLDAPTTSAVRSYLKEFLSDPRVVEIPRTVWWRILNGIILNTRAKKPAAKYVSIWQPEGSPLRVYTDKQTTLRTIWHFHDDAGYIKALAANINDYWMKHGRPEKLAMGAKE